MPPCVVKGLLSDTVREYLDVRVHRHGCTPEAQLRVNASCLECLHRIAHGIQESTLWHGVRPHSPRYLAHVGLHLPQQTPKIEQGLGWQSFLGLSALHQTFHFNARHQQALQSFVMQFTRDAPSLPFLRLGNNMKVSTSGLHAAAVHTHLPCQYEDSAVFVLVNGLY